MARIKWPRLGAAYSPRIRGVFLSYPHPLHGFLARSWPRKRGKYPPSVRWNIAQWAEAASLAVSPHPTELATAKNWARGTDFTWRDIITMFQAGSDKAIDLTTSDGTVWQGKLCMSDNPQFLLDMIDSNVGAMLYRDTVGWIGLDPGTNGYVLTMLGGKPVWLPSGASSALAMIGPPRFTNLGFASFAFGFVGCQVIRMAFPMVVNKISFWAQAAAATAHITPVVYKLTTPASATLAGSGPTVTGATVGKNTLPMGTGVTLNIGDLAMIGALIRIAAVSIFAEPSQPLLTLAYNTNDTPPAGPSTFTWGTGSWGGFYAEA